MDQLERAAREGLRVAITRRGIEYIVVARRIAITSRAERLVGILPMTGDEMEFDLAQVDSIEVLS
jgi:hypothetical protein